MGVNLNGGRPVLGFFFGPATHLYFVLLAAFEMNIEERRSFS